MGKNNFKTSIGGQALIEGVMMRGPKKTAMATRLPSGEMDVESWDNPQSDAWYRKTPFVRGVFNLIDSLSLGYKCLMRSANKAGFDDEEPTKFEKWLARVLGKSLTTIVSAMAMILGVGLAVGLFMVLPAFLTGLMRGFLTGSIARSLVEGLVKIILFVLYLVIIARMEEIRRVFCYHGAEHKTIACYEAGEELTVENIRGKTRFHPRCGTSFLLIVLVISILVFSVVTWESVLVRVLLKILMLPVVVAVAYEIIKYAGRHENPLTRVISAPGLWLQRLTTNEPDDAMIETAIASLLPVIPVEEGTDAW